MKKITVGILAHVDSGKTTLAEALLYCSGNIGKLGRVDHKNSYLDNDEMERKRGITIFSKQAILTYNNTEFTLLDTPGHIDFSAETERTLQVLDYAVLVISGTDGVQGHTHTLWKLLHRYHIPVFIYVNKMDLPHTHKTEILAQLKSTLNYDCTDFSQYISKDNFFESIALCDESIFEEYSETGFVREDLIVRAIQKRKLFPCIFGSALKLDGIKYFLEILDKYTVMPDYGKTFAGKVFKVTQDKQGNRLTFVKITGGKLSVKDILPSEKNSNSEKVNQIRIYSGEKFKTIDTAESGTVCALTGITFTQCGDTLGTEKTALMPLLQSVLTYTVILPENKDIRTVFHDLKLLEEQDPQLNILFNQQTNTIEIHLMGEIQQDIIQNMVRERFGYEIGFGKGNIIYKETIAKKVEGVGHFEPLRHYAEVHLLLEPSQRGSGITFKSDCSEDVLAKNWQRLIMTHLSEKIYTGVLTNSPLTDMTITLVSGKAHTKHTEGGDFRQATYRAVRQGLMQAENILLEPVYEYRLEIPTENTGKAMSDIQSMHGTFTVDESNNGYTVLTGNVPVATMNEYHKEVTRYTHGKGRLTCFLKGYELCHNSQEVIEQLAYDSENDVLNPCDSVFCSHGAGHIVKWNEVFDYMHLPSILDNNKTNTPDNTMTISSKSQRRTSDIFEQDKELMAIFERTYGTIKKDKRSSFQPTREIIAKEKTTSATSKPQKPKYNGKEYLLVDGYNVIFSWEKLKEIAEDNLDTARNTLIHILCNYQGYRQCELILVFDAYKVKGNTRTVEKINNISIVYTKEAETADAYIEKVTHEIAKNNHVRVVTSDALEQLIILGNGALRISSQSFLAEVIETEKEIRLTLDNLK